MPSTPPNGETKRCSSCGQPFGCGAQLNECWCASVELDEVSSAGLRTKFDDCLCKACLSAYAAGPAADRDKTVGTRD